MVSKGSISPETVKKKRIDLLAVLGLLGIFVEMKRCSEQNEHTILKKKVN